MQVSTCALGSKPRIRAYVLNTYTFARMQVCMCVAAEYIHSHTHVQPNLAPPPTPRIYDLRLEVTNE